MMNSPMEPNTQVKTLLDQSKEVLIALPKNHSYDTIAAALSLYLALSGKGKQVVVICPDPMTVEFNQLIGVDKISQNLGSSTGRNLVISFPYQEGSIEKVSYNIENDTFNLVIEPREGYPQITPDVIRYSNSGGNTELIVTINSPVLEDLDLLYTNNQALFNEKPIINIDNSGNNSQYGRVNLVNPNSSSTSEVVLTFLEQNGFTIDQDIATNILAGITAATNNFSSRTTTAATFEAAAICLRNNARKIPVVADSAPRLENAPRMMSRPQPFQQPEQPFVRPQPQPQRSQPQQFSQRMNMPQPRPSFMQRPPMQRPRPTQSQPQPQHQPQQQPQPQQQQQSQHQSGQQQGQKQQNDAPPDWLKPKIYKGSTLL